MNNRQLDSSMTPPVDWKQAIGNNRRWLTTVVYARVHDATAVDDVMQELALAAIKCRDSLSGHQAVSRWLYRVAVRQALLYRRNHFREQQKRIRLARQHETSGQVLAGHDPSRDGDPYQILARLEDRQQVRDALAKLRPKEREVLLLKYVEEWSCRQMANKLGLPETTIKARLVRARLRLKEILTANDHDHE